MKSWAGSIEFYLSDFFLGGGGDFSSWFLWQRDLIIKIDNLISEEKKNQRKGKCASTWYYHFWELKSLIQASLLMIFTLHSRHRPRFWCYQDLAFSSSFTTNQ